MRVAVFNIDEMPTDEIDGRILCTAEKRAMQMLGIIFDFDSLPVRWTGSLVIE